MWEDGAAIRIDTKDNMAEVLRDLLSRPKRLEELRVAGRKFAEDQRGVVGRIMQVLTPVLDEAIGIMPKAKGA